LSTNTARIQAPDRTTSENRLPDAELANALGGVL
jgi:hypothetical protein